MSLLEDLNGTLDPLGIPIETGVFQDTPPEEYLVITPLSDSFGFHADDLPQYEVQEARIELDFLLQKGQLYQTEKPDRPRPSGGGLFHNRPPVYRP